MATYMTDDHHLLARYRREQEQARTLVQEVDCALEEGRDISRAAPATQSMQSASAAFRPSGLGLAVRCGERGRTWRC
jgi:hypothetical protein